MADRRTAAKLIRFHPAELSLVTQLAHARGLTPARYIRERALGAMPRPKRHADTAQVLHALARSGRDLDQLARIARMCGDLSAADRLAAVLDAHMAAVRRIAHGPHAPDEEEDR